MKNGSLLLSSLLLGSTLFTSSLFANTDAQIVGFEKNRLAKNPNVKIEDIQIFTKKDLPQANWKGYILNIKGEVKGKQIEVKDVLFSDGKVIAPDLFDIKTGKSLKSLITPDLTSDYYKKDKLIAGNPNAKNKMVVFSDPLCPYCMDLVPDIIKFVKENEENIALYYYHYPLAQIHPASIVLSKLMEVAKHKGVSDTELKIYKADWEEYFKVDETNPVVILKAFNTEFNTNITLQEIMDKNVDTTLATDMKMGDDLMITGTPTVYVNGKKDRKRKFFDTLGKK